MMMTTIVLHEQLAYQHGVQTNDCGCQSTSHKQI